MDPASGRHPRLAWVLTSVEPRVVIVHVSLLYDCVSSQQARENVRSLKELTFNQKEQARLQVLNNVLDTICRWHRLPRSSG